MAAHRVSSQRLSRILAPFFGRALLVEASGDDIQAFQLVARVGPKRVPAFSQRPPILWGTVLVRAVVVIGRLLISGEQR